MRSALVWMAFLLAAGSVRAATDESVLMAAFLQTHLTHSVGSQTDAWTDEVDEQAGKEIAAASDAWCKKFRAGVRKRLESQFGGEKEARAKLTEFVNGFMKAEKEEDSAYLKNLCSRLQLPDPKPANYAALREAALQQGLAEDMNRASVFLSGVQTWVEKKKEGTEELPDLASWLKAVQAPPPPANPLAGAEAGLGSFQGGDDEEGSPLDDFRDRRADKRKKALDQARDGMATVARERAAAEQEEASRKTVAAAAEAEAMQRHAQKLAAVEKEALEQRKNSWTSKLKGIVSSTIGTATGVFFGSVGQRAGEAVTDAVFE